MFIASSWLRRLREGTAVAALVAAIIVAGLPAAAEPPAKEADGVPPTAKPVDPDGLRIHLMDGSQIGGKLAASELQVETSYGLLRIPVAAIVSLTPGLGSHPKVGQSISDLIEKLGSPQFAEREAAQKALVEMGPAVRLQIERAAGDADTERRTRVKAILEEFEQLEEDATDETPANRPVMIDRDQVQTTDFTVVGRIVQQEFEIVSRYGPLKVQLSDIRRIDRDLAEREELQKSIAVDGNHIIHRGLKDSGIRLQRGDKVSITADGTIQMTPWGNQAFSTPEGAQNFGWYQQNRIAGGALVGKIGSTGAVFRIGSKHSFTADRSGVLHLAVAMQQDYANQNFPGEYRVKVRVKRK